MKISFYIILLLIIELTCTHTKVENLFDDMYSGDIYSGYLETSNPNHQLFYVFTPSQSQTPTTDPLILWLHGGPGCSALSGLLMEVGPVVTDKFSGFFHINEYAWNKNANIIFIESPAGIGYSINTDASRSFDDETVGKENFYAFKQFITNEFPQYANNDFYLTGASYSGVVLPYFIKEYYNQSELRLNLKGFFVGNALTSFESDCERAQVHFGYGHSIVGHETMKAFERNCPYLDFGYNTTLSMSSSSNELDPKNVTHRCNEIRQTIKEEFDGVDLFGIYHQCVLQTASNNNNNSNKRVSQNERILNTRKQFNKANININADDENEEEISITPSYCEDDYFMPEFMNRESTKRKLNISSMDMSWWSCGDVGDYPMSESLPIYNNVLFPNNLRIWHFSGDADGCVPTLGTQYWINKLNMAIKTEWKAWHARNQVAGFVQEYENNFVFLTVKGAGHIATYDRREEMYIAWNAFLNGTLPS